MEKNLYTIGLVAPSGPLKNTTIPKITKELEKRNFKVKVGESCFSKHIGYLAGNDDLRANDINKMFQDEEIDIILCIRGGYGSARLLEKLDYNMIKENKKPFIGFSDITSLHIAFNQICNMPTYHGLMAYSIEKWDEFSENSFRKMLDKSNYPLSIINPPKEELETVIDGSCKGILAGGNLAIMVSSLGTKYEIDVKDKILFIEEIDETTYKLDRMLNQLDLAGKFNDCVGVIFGDFCDCNKQSDEELDLKELILEKLQKYNKPVLMNLKAGHCMPMVSLPLGYECELDATKKSITILSRTY